MPLHLIDPDKDLVDEVGRFVQAEGVLTQNPLDPNSPESNLTIIFDGLDELASQGKAAAETARGFVREVEKTLERRNLQSTRLRILISGREVVIQENESEFRRNRQILFLLPYALSEGDRQDYQDAGNLLKTDLRRQWWQAYARLTGKDFDGLPSQLARGDLDEITAQPLLNFLLALSFTRGKVNFEQDVNLNLIYADLVDAVYERGYEKRRPYVPIRQMKFDGFSRVLEEIGLASWHGDGRTTTVREIEEHCKVSEVGKLLDVFQEGAKAGITRLLAAFFFRQYGVRASGDPTFVFTHKSFGENLTARRIVRGVIKIVRELQLRDEDPDQGWDEKEALKYWVQLCGPSAMTGYLLDFIRNEIQLRSVDEISSWQQFLIRLFNYMLRHGMPMEQTGVTPFSQAMFQSRNAEESLLAVLNACAQRTEQISAINPPSPTAFGAWFKRIQGQRTGAESAMAAQCLSYLDLSRSVLFAADLWRANLTSSKLNSVVASYANLREAFLTGADLTFALLVSANLGSADLGGVHLESANLRGAYLGSANLRGANLRDASLRGANLKHAKLEGANLEGALGIELAQAAQQAETYEASPPTAPTPVVRD